jgi:hypothetical protein
MFGPVPTLPTAFARHMDLLRKNPARGTTADPTAFIEQRFAAFSPQTLNISLVAQ